MCTRARGSRTRGMCARGSRARARVAREAARPRGDVRGHERDERSPGDAAARGFITASMALGMAASADDAEASKHVDAAVGDLLLAPVGWLRHWVPPIDGDSTRTAIIFNMVCL